MDVDNNNDVFGNCLEFVLPRMMYLLDNNNFQTARYSKPFCMMMFFWRWFWREAFISGLASFCRILEYMHLQHMQMHVEVDDFIFVLLQLEFTTNSGEQCACMHVPGSSMLHEGIKETETTRHRG